MSGDIQNISSIRLDVYRLETVNHANMRWRGVYFVFHFRQFIPIKVRFDQEISRLSY